MSSTFLRACSAGRKTIRRCVAAVLVAAWTVTGCSTETEPTDLLEIRGDWTFVNYWAEWCKPCIKEIPELNALHQQSGFRVLGVNYDGASGEDLQRQLRTLGVEFPTLPADPAERFAVVRPQVLPTTLVLSPDGELQRVLIGPQTEASLLAAATKESAGG